MSSTGVSFELPNTRRDGWYWRARIEEVFDTHSEYQYSIAAFAKDAARRFLGELSSEKRQDYVRRALANYHRNTHGAKEEPRIALFMRKLAASLLGLEPPGRPPKAKPRRRREFRTSRRQAKQFWKQLHQTASL